MTAAPVLTIAGLSVALPTGAERAWAVEDLSLEVRAGEIVCVVGESGSGKSVTAYTCLGLLARRELTPRAGSIRLEGEEILDAPPRRLRRLRGRRMPMVFQEPATALNPVLRCGAQIDEVLRLHTRLDRNARAARVHDILGQVELGEPRRIARSFPHQLSGGERQRVVLAMALVLEPALLIADEPTSALDVTTQARILRLVRALCRRHGTGVLFVTHDFGVVAEIADRVVVMHRGRVVESGPVADVLHRPAEPYTRRLLDAVPRLTPPPARAGGSGGGGAPVLEVAGLVKTYRSGGLLGRARVVHAVRGVDLCVGCGEIVGVVGESGSGKSTLARCIARLIRPTAGEIRLGGTDLARLSTRALRPQRRRVQLVFQDPYRSLNPRRSIAASLIEGPTNFGARKAEATARARELLGFVGIDAGALGRLPHQFSGGQRQRICLARALLMEPDLLVADEVVSALDVSVQAQVLDLLKRICTDFDLAVVFITHDLRVAAQICDHLLVMHRGEVVEAGPTFDLFQTPRQAYTRSLILDTPGREWSFQREAS